MLLHSDHVRVQVLDVLDIRKDKGLFGVKAEGDDVLDVAETHRNRALRSFKFQLGTVDVLLIVGDLDDDRQIERFLQPLTKDEWDSVTKMESFGGWASSGVEVERLLLLVCLQDVI